ncbi:MAG: site-2 protease family protein [Chloroflexi bacterium]|nr:site-2 protease family protein [Chloroflexota bacterium]
MTAITFIVLLGLLVFFHELGHFVLAKRAGIRVEEFGFGFPPRLVGIRRGETIYSINAIPLGGFVRMLGEEDPAEPRSFARASRWWRVVILFAGSGMNLLLATLLFAGAYTSGWPTVTRSEVEIARVVSGSPAESGGLRAGDRIVSFAGQPIERAEQLRRVTQANLGREVPVVIQRGDTQLTLTVRPRTTWPADEAPLGVSILDRPVKIEPVSSGPITALVNGAQRTVEIVVLTFYAPVLVLRGVLPAELVRPVGPVGIYAITSAAATETVATGWWFPILNVAASLSAGLGIANLLPIPGLDGGRLLFVALEAIRGRRVSPEREGLVHMMGLAFLLSLVLAITWLDVRYPIDLDFGLR